MKKSLKYFLTILMMVIVMLSFGQRGERSRENRESRTRTEVRGNNNSQRREMTQRSVQQQPQRTEQRSVQQRPERNVQQRGIQQKREVSQQDRREIRRDFPDREIKNRPNVRDNRGIRDMNYSRYYRKDHLPYYFKSNSYYWHHPTYGHVIKRFYYNPIVIYSNRFPFYIDNGFLYRYYNGIGYVWIENPYDMWFDELPYGASRIIVNGYLYFKVGHAFFQFRQHLGYRLVILPEQYYNY